MPEEEWSYRFTETIGMPPYLWVAVLAGLGGIAFGLIAPLFDNPKSWTWYVLYYPVMLAALAAFVVAVGSFRRLRTAVTDEAVEFGFGRFRQRLPLDSIQSVKVKRYNWLLYGGWGLQVSWGGRRAYSVMGVPRGVEITVRQGTKVRRYFVSSTQPERFASSLAP